MIAWSPGAWKPTPSTVNRVLRLTHIYSAAPVLLLMFFFAVTGLYLNHPDFDEGRVSNSRQELSLPPWAAGSRDESAPPADLVLRLLQWLDREHDISGIDLNTEYDDLDDILVIDLASPDGTTLVEVFFEDAIAAVDQRELSLLAKLNNLHRAKHVSGLWRYLSDFSAICMLLFSASGCWLLVRNRRERKRASIVLLSGCGLFLMTALVLH